MSRYGRTVIFAAVAFAAPARAAIDLSWYTIDGGGGFSAGGAFEVRGTIGQPDAGYMSGGRFEFVGGFWGASMGSVAPPCPGDLDRDNDVDIGDLSILLSQFGSFGFGLAGDLDQDGDVDIADLSTLLSNFGVICR